MSWTPVDFGLVRYSPVEGTHYFFDPAYPTAIQFLLNGRWEPWDVSYVKFKAQDADVRRIAEDAEARLIRDNTVPGYRQWPSPPPPGGLSTQPAGPAPSESAASTPLHSPSSLFFDHPSPAPQSQPRTLPSIHPPSSSASHAHRAAVPQTPSSAYTSPYGFEPLPSPSNTIPPTPIASATAQPVLPPIVTSLSGPSNGARHPTSAPHEPHPQPPAVPSVVPSKSRETKVLLSLDGDGIRGLSQMLLVESLVNAVCTKIGAQVDPYQVFDLIGGTSMGGIIAIMVGRLRMQAHRAREAYKQIAKEVFSNKRDFFTSFDPHAPPKSHDGQAVENAIKAVAAHEVGNLDELLLDSRDDSADVFVVCTQIDIGTNKAALIRSFSTRRITGPELDANMTVWQAMLATSVAPRYMLPRDGVNWRPVIEPGLVDHGTSKNNPIRDIRYECSKLHRYGNDTMVIVSIGTGTGLVREIPEMVKSVNDRTNEASLWGEKFEADHQALMERGWMKYFRFNVDLNDVPLEEWCHEDKVREKTLAYLGRPDVGQMFYACVDAITTVLLSGNMGREAVLPGW
ncbi:FabD/lysophospholipase-like protein [Lentithecium fluviatile CBS 122367]|uniref:FabD/lysophospholipase-like protein n=1 Tax=Lentithecium fluviatile CBS 122367 TaxID=1168545 RepID=A0A6G1IQU0_9PLEO|nr:FabD/lysophospholipase-like protein [Lentithecium fluviatile CBS 122367]